MSSPAEKWLRDYNEASKLADEINNMVSEASTLPPTGPQTQRHFSATRRKITILKTKLDNMGRVLAQLPSLQTLTGREMNRRNDMMTNLTSKVNQMADTLNLYSSAYRDRLLGVDTKSDDVMKRASNMDNHSLVGFQRQVIREQDEDLGKLEETVVSTKHIALAVNEELTLHTRLLENLDDHLEATSTRLQLCVTEKAKYLKEIEELLYEMGESFVLPIMLMSYPLFQWENIEGSGGQGNKGETVFNKIKLAPKTSLLQFHEAQDGGPILAFGSTGNNLFEKFFAIARRIQRRLAILNKNTKGGCCCLVLTVMLIVVLILVVLALIKYL